MTSRAKSSRDQCDVNQQQVRSAPRNLSKHVQRQGGGPGPVVPPEPCTVQASGRSDMTGRHHRQLNVYRVMCSVSRSNSHSAITCISVLSNHEQKHVCIRPALASLQLFFSFLARSFVSAFSPRCGPIIFLRDILTGSRRALEGEPVFETSQH